jgi:sortase A
MRRKTIALATVIAAVAGAALIAHGLWIPLKAELAQILLRKAWESSLRSGEPIAPWPWADTHPVAQMTVGDPEERIIVLSGASGRTMAFGPAHLDGSAKPGARGNCVITAHRDTHFSGLQQLRPGDSVSVWDDQKRSHSYRVRETMVVDQDETWVMAETPDTRLTLITCYPFDSVVPRGRQRYVVIAEAKS